LAGAVIAKAQSSYEPYAVSTIAGATPALGGDTVGGVKGFNLPSGVAVDSAGNLYVANTDDHTIRKVTAAGLISTLAGAASSPGYADGAGGAARFSYPKGVAMDGAGNVYVADAVNQIIRRITPAAVSITLPRIAIQRFNASRRKGSNWASGTIEPRLMTYLIPSATDISSLMS
jgi:sugar lactone lactonase YvrE